MVEVEPIGAPCSSGTLSKPTRGPDDELLAAVEVDGALEVEGAVDAGELVLVAVADDVVELLPQAAGAQAAIRAMASPVRPRARRRRLVSIGAQP